MQARAGQQVYIACLAEGNPAPKIEWYKIGDGTIGESNSDRQREFLGPELRFSPAEQRHSGQYECRASNAAEEDLVAKIKLDVLGK